MAGSYRLTSNAYADLDGIVGYTLRTWSARQGDKYLAELEACFERLVSQSGLEQNCDHIRPGLRRQKQGHHYVFYVHKPYGVRVVRILHESMDHEEHDFTEEEERG